jgi:4-diphosphocytidyl-2-C-methyl-D-erythritol kinase
LRRRIVKVSVRCPAKVNLHLEVLGRRADGYHELRTIFAATGVWDTLTFAGVPGGKFELAVDPPSAVTAGEDNLVLRAARAVAEHLGEVRGARILLEKRIPVAGGLGGGSADAAATLVGLPRLWDRHCHSEELARLAVRLGADVSFFLCGGVAWGTGRGSDLMPLSDLPPWWVLAVPGPEPVSTAEVYQALDAAALDAGGSTEIYEWVTAGGELPLGSCRNDLQPTVLARWPEIGRRLESVRASQPLLALVSGSGGTVFGVFDSEQRTRRAAAEAGATDVIVAPLLTREASLLRPSVMEE